MDAGPSGFRNAPLTKAIVLTVSTTSLLWLTGVLKPHRRPSKLLLSVAFPQTGSLIFGLALLYQFRNLERQAGTSKHGALVAMGLAVQWLATLFGTQMPLGPFSLIFACLTLFLLETPAMQHFSVFGVRLTEKVFTQAAALQLLLSSPRSAILSMVCGVLLGVAYHANAMGMRSWKIPGPVSAGFGRVLGPLLQDRQSQRTLVRPVQTDSRSPTMGSLQRPMGQRSRPAAAVTASREAVEQLVAMGFSEVDARSALERSNNDVQAATSLLL